MIGQTIAHYRITAKLGEGGMGAVYRATDTKLHRDVAIKVLPDAFAADADRMARFQREAQVLASLNHPNIAAIYGVEDRALIMELVEGDDLAGPLPVNRAVDYAHQITDALSAAHDKGIVHRDLKPANIKITPEGMVKVLDFGLAKATESKPDTIDPINSPTVVAGTMAGVIMGTAAYMAPEQARGQAVDKRADIWAFGVVLFEMLTGKLLFTGETVSDTLASVMKDEIDYSALPKDTPPDIRLLLERCLERDRKRRLRDLGDAWLEAPASPPSRHKRATMTWAAVAAVSLLAAFVASSIAWRATRPVERPLMRFRADVAGEAELARARTGTLLALSPDGRRLAVTIRAADGQIRLASRLLDQGQLTVLPGTDDAYGPFFSPDSQWIGFFAGGKLKKISVNGGAAVTLCDAQTGRGASWGDDGSIVAAPTTTGPLSRIPASGGTPTAVTKLNQGERTHRHPFVLPGSKAVLFTAHTGANVYDDANIDVASLSDGQRKTVHRGGYSPLVLPSGHMVYTHQRSMFAAPFDSAKLALGGAPVPVLEDLGDLGVSGEYSCSTTGTLVYLSGKSGFGRRSLAWLTPSGETSPLLPATGAYTGPRFSPDGKHLLLGVAIGSNEDLWIKDVERGTFSRLTFLPGWGSDHVWTPDGKHIFFDSGTTTQNRALYVVRSDGSGEARRVTSEQGAVTPESLTPDGRRMILTRGGNFDTQPIYTVTVEWNGDHPTLGKPELLLPASPGSPGHPRLSPDGRWLAYSSSESGRTEVYVRPFPGPGGKWQISTAGGTQPEWSPKGSELFFMDQQGRLNVTGYTVSAVAFQWSPPRTWPEKRIVLSNFPSYAVAPAGKRIAALLMRETEGEGKLTHLVFLVNFFDEVRRRIRAGGAQ